MPGASSMRGVTGFRVLDALNGALAQLIPDRVAGRGRGRQHARDLRRRPARTAASRFIFYELVVGTWGGTPDRRRQRRPHEPGEPRREHPGRGRRVGVPDRRSSATGSCPTAAAPGEHRGGLAIERVWRCLTPEHVADRALRPRRRTRRTASPAAAAGRARRRNVLHAARRHRGGAAVDVLDDDRRGRRLRAPHGGRRRLGRPARARARARRATTCSTRR